MLTIQDYHFNINKIPPINLGGYKTKNKIMTKEKKEAKKLIYKYQYLVPTWDCYNDCDIEIEYRLPAMKECALEAVEFALKFITGDLNESFDKTMYLLEIKKEIENYNEQK